MIRAIGNKRLNLSDEEFSYYNKLIEHIDSSEFNGIFESDKNGIILNVMPNPNKQSSLVVYFFLMNVSFNQRLRKLDGFLSYKDRMDDAFEKIKNIENKLN